MTQVLENEALRPRFENACKLKEQGKVGRAYRKLKALSKERGLGLRDSIEIRLQMAVCLRLIGRLRAADWQFRHILQLADRPGNEELVLRILLDWSAVLLDRGQPQRAIANLGPEFDRLLSSHPLQWKAMAYVGRAYVRTGVPHQQEEGLTHLTNAIEHLTGSMRRDAMRWKLEAKTWPGANGKAERRAHYEKVHALVKKESLVLVLDAYCSYLTGARLRPVSVVAYATIYRLRSLLP